MRWITLLALGWVLSTVHATGAAEPVVISESITVGTQIQTKLHLILRGEIQVDSKDEKVVGQALLLYPERVLTLDDAGLPASVLRFYDDARAKFVIGKSEDPRQLRANVRMVVGQTSPKGLELWSTAGPLDSDEVELIEDVLDTTQIPGLLPGKEVKEADKWEPPQAVQSRLCDMEEIIATTIECSLKSLSDDEAVISLAGKIHGVSYGSEVKSNVEATLTFDRSQKMVTHVEWKQIDSRAPSPVSPAGAYEVTITIDRTPGSSPMLTDRAIANIDTKPSAGSRLLTFEDPKKRFAFLHDRKWHVTMLEDDRAILRRLDGRDMVAQLNIHVLGENKNVAELSAEQLQTMIIQAGELKIDEIVRSEAIPTDGPHQIKLVSAKGSKGNLQLVQHHYIAQDSAGRQILFTFLTEPTKEQKLAEEDLALIQTVNFPENTASRQANRPR